MTALSDITVRAVSPRTILMLAALVVLITISALVSASEVAFFSLSPQMTEKLKDGKDRRDSAVSKLLRQPQMLLATILILNNLVNVSIVMLSAMLGKTAVDFGEHTTLKFIFESVIITALILFFGEIMPKIYAKQRNYSFSRFMAFPLTAAEKILWPASRLLMKSTSVMNSRMSRYQPEVSIDDLSQALELTGNDIKEEKEILEGIVNFTELSASDIMTPRMDVVSVDIHDKFSKVLQVVLDSGYSRIPAYDERPDEIKGILYVKDLLPHLEEKNYNWASILRKPFYIPETKKINDLLEEFQLSKTHMAIVVDEYGGMSGIVTLEDVLEEIVGDIKDEFDEEDKAWTRQADGSIIFEGKISLNDFFKVIDVDPDEFKDKRGDAETLAGFLLELNGLIPQKGDILTFEKYKFEVIAADARRIKKVKFSTNK
ncbi:MAG: gliding motility-associated protein GldE [Bacteroidales bacterium]|jgi:gliding motility-associated protein GldE|nr:gliding motility-associated protein GldE [Bacteroidales bacterium]